MDFSEYPFLTDVSWGEIIFLAFFSAGIAFFYSLIIGELYKIKYKPVWLFFALLPSIIIIAGAIDKPFGLIAFFIIFVATFPLMITGIIYKAIKDEISTSKNRWKKKTPLWRVILNILKFIVFFLVLFFSGPYVVVIFFLYFIYHFITSKKASKTFFKLQAILPTSKIRSMAMGLVELQGKAEMITSIKSRIGKKDCIGYTYKIESVSRDKDGRDSYTTLSKETVCNPFLLKDATGSVEVTGENIEFLKLEESDSYRGSGKRYTQYLLLNNTEVLLIGKANNKNQKVIIEKETIKNIFALAPIKKVTLWNKYQPLRKSLKVYAAAFIVGIALVLMMNVDYNKDNNTITVGFETSYTPWDIKTFLNKF